jgi:CheY-like chemotaxis protein
VKLPLMVVREKEARDVDVPGRKHPTAYADAQLEWPEEIKGLRLLVIDDEADARQLLSAILAQAGAVVETAESAEEARQQLVDFRPHVLLSDIEMPGEDGYTFMRQLRASEPVGSRIPAAALTAHVSVGDRMRALAAGFDIHVPKPIEPAELLTVVASLASRVQRDTSLVGGV